ncbi:CSEP0033 putative effector protein [Blumeria hordei DH14]|uniref:CSEP0033 putative effector protein n=1 Tax=Blumeria graminis f. sp. hordei (strain DH14) TaxID=546991 RepID=N1J9Y7_BLUG1|nr:CSEP0033 putative effector protein [Blumeria hordei DH14]
MRFSKLAIIIYAARFISAASNYKTAHIEEERKGFICDGEFFSEAQFRAERSGAVNDLKNGNRIPILAEEFMYYFVSEQQERLMMYDNGDAKEHYSFPLPSLAKVVYQNRRKFQYDYHLVLDDSARVCALILWKIDIHQYHYRNDGTHEICSISS